MSKWIKADILPGGQGDDLANASFDEAVLEAGILHELEHTTDRGIAAEIAKDHLTEDSEYYQKLKWVEN